MRFYRHLSLKEREMILIMINGGANLRSIALSINRSPSTISREMTRNQYSKSIRYLPDRAHQESKDRKYRLTPKLERYPELKDYVIARLKEESSPDVIAGILCKTKGFNVSTETIYQYIYSQEGQALKLYQYLATERKKRNQRHVRKHRKCIIPNRVSIHERPEAANNRDEFGHFEADLTFFKGNQSANLLVITERKSRFSFFIKNTSKKADLIGKSLFNTLAKLPKSMRKSVTFDNGGEFAKHGLITDFLGIDTYFCDPHSPWQKGQVEKTNAMLHRFIPKNTSILPFSGKDLKTIQNKFNRTPRKILGYETPEAVFNRYLRGVALQT